MKRLLHITLLLLFGSIAYGQEELTLHIHPVPDASEDFGIFTINGEELNYQGDGTYAIQKSALLTSNNILSYSPAADLNSLAGISSLDLVMMLKQLLNVEDLEPWQIIAADIDHSGGISFTKDFIKMKRMILGMDDQLNFQKTFILRNSGNAVDIDPYEFTHDFDSFTFSFEDLTRDNGLFVDIYKYGDLSDDFSVNTRSDNTLELLAKDIYVNKGESHVIPIKIKDPETMESFLGLQLAFQSTSGEIALGNHPYGEILKSHQPTADQLNIVMVTSEALDELSMEIIVTPGKSGNLSDILRLDSQFLTEFITENLETWNITLDFESNTFTGDDDSALGYLKVAPNPVFEELTIQTSSEDIGKTVYIYDITGSLVHSQVISKRRTTIDKSDLGNPGMKLVQVGERIFKEKIIVY